MILYKGKAKDYNLKKFLAKRYGVIVSKKMTIKEAMQNFRAIGEVLYVPKCL